MEREINTRRPRAASFPMGPAKSGTIVENMDFQTSLETRLSFLAENVKIYAYSDAAQPPQLAAWDPRNSFFNAIQQAYSQHYHLIFRPADLWLTIAQGVSAHINHAKNAELYRDKFVAHKGKQEVRVKVDHVHWPECVDKLITAEVNRIMMCDFSTATGVVRTASQVVLMGEDRYQYTIETERGGQSAVCA
ncbi:hypothetical protein BC936DRAFT_137140 [Jimgerdemannia flammicorona]|uniref:Uncharacterized protein n=1 Tax=Jimgerdemannia flammicorona TaxID=994334 RepID=A0A433CXZ9_9FUNG|nr:hypothetical protein BC936DRAFT_137140 [Jimgerdemannia flammicorona]